MPKRDCWGRRWTRAIPERVDELEITFEEHEESKAVQCGNVVPGLLNYDSRQRMVGVSRGLTAGCDMDFLGIQKGH